VVNDAYRAKASLRVRGGRIQGKQIELRRFSPPIAEGRRRIGASAQASQRFRDHHSFADRVQRTLAPVCKTRCASSLSDRLRQGLDVLTVTVMLSSQASMSLKSGLKHLDELMFRNLRVHVDAKPHENLLGASIFRSRLLYCLIDCSGRAAALRRLITSGKSITTSSENSGKSRVRQSFKLIQNKADADLEVVVLLISIFTLAIWLRALSYQTTRSVNVMPDGVSNG